MRVLREIAQWFYFTAFTTSLPLALCFASIIVIKLKVKCAKWSLLGALGGKRDPHQSRFGCFQSSPGCCCSFSIFPGPRADTHEQALMSWHKHSLTLISTKTHTQCTYMCFTGVHTAGHRLTWMQKMYQLHWRYKHRHSLIQVGLTLSRSHTNTQTHTSVLTVSVRLAASLVL